MHMTATKTPGMNSESLMAVSHLHPAENAGPHALFPSADEGAADRGGYREAPGAVAQA